MNLTYSSNSAAFFAAVALALFLCYIPCSNALNQSVSGKYGPAKWNNSQTLRFGLLSPQIAFLNRLPYRAPRKLYNVKSLTNDYGREHVHDQTNARINSFTSLEMAETTMSEWRGAQAISKLTESTSTAVFDIEKIKELLPHRFPFLLVDKVLEFEPGKRAVGIKQVSSNEDQFNGHFPQRAVMPGVLQVEALAQLGGIIALQHPVSDGKGNFFFAGVDGVKWKKPVVPGDTLVMEVSLECWKEKFGIAKMVGKGYVDGKIAVEVKEMTFALVR